LYEVFSAPELGLYALISGEKATAVVLKEPNCTPLLLAWLLIHTKGGGPENKPIPPLPEKDLL